MPDIATPLDDPDAIKRFLYVIASRLPLSADFRDLYGKQMGPAPGRRRRPRKPDIRKMIAAAERDGKNVTSITTPDGVTLHFGKGESTDASNPWLDDLKVTKQ